MERRGLLWFGPTWPSATLPKCQLGRLDAQQGRKLAKPPRQPADGHLGRDGVGQEPLEPDKRLGTEDGCRADFGPAIRIFLEEE